MRWRYTIPLRLRSLFRRPLVEGELDEELRSHLERRIAHEIAAGRTRQEARTIAIRAMDGLEQRKEECRDVRHMNLIDNLLRDTRFAVRMLARSPGFTVATLVALALGIGANTAVFSVVNSVLLRPLPFAESERLVMVLNSRPLFGIKMLYGVTALDTVTFASVALLLGTVAIVASLIPALRAARIDPVTALRQD